MVVDRNRSGAPGVGVDNGWSAAFVVALALVLGACGSSYGGAAGGGVALDGGSADGGGASDAGGTSGGGTSGGGTSGGGTSGEVDPSCLDGQYTETLPTGKEDISDLVASYSADKVMDFITGTLDRRYPIGAFLVKGAVASAPQNCVDVFLPQQLRGSASQVLSRMGVIVHECGHFYDIYGDKSFGQTHYQLTEKLSFTCSGAAHQGSNTTFARSLIKQDAWAKANPPCAKLGDKGCDSYAPIYLNGDPTDGKFESGDQGFNMLMEEVVQYVNSLAEAVAFRDQIKGSTSARDGILTFLWYMTRYLQMARLEHPDAYKVLAGDPCWRQTILTVWGRAWLYLAATEGDKALTVKGDKLLKNAREPKLMAEIQLIREAHGCK